MKSTKISHIWNYLKNTIKACPQHILSVFSALIFSIIIVSGFQENPTQQLMASVSQLHKYNEDAISTDILIKNNQDEIIIQARNKLHNATYIEGIIIFNPDSSLDFSTEENITKLSAGMYKFNIPLQDKTISKGTIIAHFHKNTPNTEIISITDLQFISQGNRYNLSSHIE